MESFAYIPILAPKLSTKLWLRIFCTILYLKLSLQILCFSGWPENQDDRPDLWLIETFSTSLQPLNLIRRNLTGSKNSWSSTKSGFFFEPFRNQDDHPGFWLAGLFMTLCNRWTELNETWQEASTKRYLPILCISGRSENKDWLPGLWLAETFLTSPMQALNGIWRNLGQKQFVYFDRK